MFNFTKALKSERLMKSLTGMKIEEFKQLAKELGKILYEVATTKDRQRKVGGGQKGALRSTEDNRIHV